MMSQKLLLLLGLLHDSPEYAKDVGAHRKWRTLEFRYAMQAYMQKGKLALPEIF